MFQNNELQAHTQVFQVTLICILDIDRIWVELKNMS